MYKLLFPLICATLLTGCAGFANWLGVAPAPIATPQDRPTRATDELLHERRWFPSQGVTICIYVEGGTRIFRDYHNEVLCPWRYRA